jgi:hypothetical protein
METLIAKAVQGNEEYRLVQYDCDGRKDMGVEELVNGKKIAFKCVDSVMDGALYIAWSVGDLTCGEYKSFLKQNQGGYYD